MDKTVKFLYVTDIHNKSERDIIKGRTDNYWKAILDKQIEIGTIIESQGIDVLLFGGDLFDHYDPPTSLINDVSAIWKEYKVSRIIGVIGSHDYNGYQVKTLRRTGIGNLAIHGLIELVGNKGSIFPEEIELEGGAIHITGTPHSITLSDNPENYATGCTRYSDQQYFIQLVHGDLFNAHVVWQHQTIADISPFITADMVLSGHIHSGWLDVIPCLGTRKTYYVNPGSIGRTENGKERQIRTFYFEVNINKSIASLGNYSYIPITCAHPHPFVEKVDSLEGAPVIDFTELMKMISNVEIRRIDFRQYVPTIVKELYGNSSAGTISTETIITKVIELLDSSEV